MNCTVSKIIDGVTAQALIVRFIMSSGKHRYVAVDEVCAQLCIAAHTFRRE